MSRKENENLVRRIIEEVWNQKKLDLIDETYASDYTYHAPNSPALRGPDGYRQVVTTYTSAFPDQHFTIEDLISSDDKVVLRYTTKGTHKGELMGIAPTDLSTTSSGIAIIRFSGAKIAEEWGNWDALGLLQQIGAIPPIG